MGQPATAICRWLHQICVGDFMICASLVLYLWPCLPAGQRCNETMGTGTRLAAECEAAPFDGL